MGSKNSKCKETTTSSSMPSSVVITSLDRAQLELKLQRDKLLAAIRKYELAANEARNRAAHFLRCGNSRKALYCLKCQKLQEKQVEFVTDMLDNIQKLISTIEFNEIELEVVDALKNGKNELAKLNAMLKADDVANLMESTAETVEEARRIDEILTRPLETWDDDALLEEIRVNTVEQIEKQGNIFEKEHVPNHPLPGIEASSVPEDVSETELPLYA